MSDDDWLIHAMNDDAFVVEILMRLKRSRKPPPLYSVPGLQLDWSVRQRRSKQVLRKKGEPARASPTTPLSWSGATSVSGGAADGSEESSRPPSKPIGNARSKVPVISESTAAKRSRKKKTLAELRDEEKLLLKESRDLKDEIATVRLKLEKQRVTNERFKKFKFDVLSHEVSQKMVASADDTSYQSQQTVVSCDLANVMRSEDDQSPPSGFSKPLEVGMRDSIFSLPDLNLPLADENAKSSEELYEIS